MVTYLTALMKLLDEETPAGKGPKRSEPDDVTGVRSPPETDCCPHRDAKNTAKKTRTRPALWRRGLLASCKRRTDEFQFEWTHGMTSALISQGVGRDSESGMTLPHRAKSRAVGAEP